MKRCPDCKYHPSVMFVAEYRRNEANYEPGYFDIWDSGYCCGREPPDPTHWMPLPTPPSSLKITISSNYEPLTIFNYEEGNE